MFNISQLLVAEANIVISETEAVGFVQAVKLCISFFELRDGLSELYVVHK